MQDPKCEVWPGYHSASGKMSETLSLNLKDGWERSSVIIEQCPDAPKSVDSMPTHLQGGPFWTKKIVFKEKNIRFCFCGTLLTLIYLCLRGFGETFYLRIFVIRQICKVGSFRILGVEST